MTGQTRLCASWEVTADFIEDSAMGPAAAVETVEKRVAAKMGDRDYTVKWFAWRIKPDGRGFHWVEISGEWWREIRTHLLKCSAVENR